MVIFLYYSLTDIPVKFAFFMAGRVLVRFLQEAKRTGDQVQALTVRTELEYIRYSIPL